MMPPNSAALSDFENFDRLPVGIPIMNYNGEGKFSCQADLLPKPFYLHLTGRKISEKVKADLSVGPDLFTPAEFS